MPNVFAGAATLLLTALAMATALRLVYHVRPSHDDTVRFVLVVSIWVLAAVASLAICLLLGGPLGLLLWMAALGVTVLATFQYGHAQRRALLELLSVCASKNIPLTPAIVAFAQEVQGRAGARAAHLASQLEHGIALAVALDQDRHALPHGTALAAAVGQQTGDVAGALGELNVNLDSSESVVRAVLTQLLYMLCVVFFMFFIATFMLIKIAPALLKIFQDFEIELPPITLAVFNAATTSATTSVLTMLTTTLLVITAYFALYYLGFVRFSLPGTGWFFRRLESSRILRGLALAAEHERPFTETMRAMADARPPRDIAWRLRQAASDVDRGIAWWTALERHKLAVPVETAVLAAANRVGNLPWALREMADAGLRRTLHRAEVWLQIISPLVVLALGAVVLIYVVAFFLPLVRLIESLA